MKSKFWRIATLFLTLCLIAVLVFDKWPQRIIARFRPAVVQATPEDSGEHSRETHWEHRNSYYKLLNTHDKIVLLGNSITEGVGTGWGEILKTDCIVNRGIGGERTSGILKRVDQYILDTPRCIVFMDAINDLTTNVSADSAFKNFQQIAGKVQAGKIPFIVQSTLYTAKTWNPLPVVDSVNANVDRYNSQVRTYCQAHKIEFVDITPVLARGHYLDSVYTADGLHLKGQAYLMWLEVLKPYLQKYL